MSHTEYSAQFVQYSSVFLGLEESLHDPNPIHEEFFSDLPSILNRLCEVCKQDYMNWQEVGIAVQSKVNQLIDQHNRPPELKGSDAMPSGWHPLIRAKMIGLKPYIAKGHQKEQAKQSYPIPRPYLSPQEELTVYLLRPRLRLFNVMEEMVLLAISKITNPEVHEGNTPTEVAAYALSMPVPWQATVLCGNGLLRNYPKTSS